LLLLFYTNFYQ